ncbi:MAG: rhomboid family intramembrane serine protease [Bacteroidales bacterium]|nr:rhomboid family intramembrane serine protease [Bacteroidales bacterium]
MTGSATIEKKRLWLSMFIPLLFVFLLWLIALIQYFFEIDLGHWGVFPLHAKGLPGILLSPMIHGNFEHLSSNSLPLLILGTMLFYFYPKSALKVFLLLYFVTGVWVWFGARPAYHIGSSGIVYGLASFIFTCGALLKNIRLMAVSLLVVFLYGGLIWGLFPIDWRISWESHLSGFVLGIILAILYKNENRYPENEPEWMQEDENEDESNDEIPYWKNEDTTNIA